MKRCADCRREKPTAEFTRRRNQPDGLNVYCRDCHNRHNRAWRASFGGQSYKYGENRRTDILWDKLLHTARRRGVPVTITYQQFVALRARPCAYCGGPLPEGGYGIDQKVAGAGYTPENAVPSCWPCNSFKGARRSAAETRAAGPFLRQARFAAVQVREALALAS